MSPQTVGQEQYSYETDWWSMGIILYELLQGDVSAVVSVLGHRLTPGKTPWTSSDVSIMVTKIRQEELTFRKGIAIDEGARGFIVQVGCAIDEWPSLGLTRTPSAASERSTSTFEV